jgi:hypothetical protein
MQIIICIEIKDAKRCFALVTLQLFAKNSNFRKHNYDMQINYINYNIRVFQPWPCRYHGITIIYKI